MRIAISGPSGTGKTTLAKWISQEYKIPFLETSAKPLWEKYNISCHKDIITKGIKNIEFGNDFQNDVLNLYKTNHKEYITDRSPIDVLTYYLLQNAPFNSQEKTKEFIDKCQKTLDNIDMIIKIPYNDSIILENDNKRIVNSYYQKSVNKIFELSNELLNINVKKIIELNNWDFEERKKTISNYFLASFLFL